MYDEYEDEGCCDYGGEDYKETWEKIMEEGERPAAYCSECDEILCVEPENFKAWCDECNKTVLAVDREGNPYDSELTIEDVYDVITAADGHLTSFNDWPPPDGADIADMVNDPQAYEAGFLDY